MLIRSPTLLFSMFPKIQVFLWGATSESSNTWDRIKQLWWALKILRFQKTWPLASQHQWSHCSPADLTTAVRNTAGIQSTCLEAPFQLHVLIINSLIAITSFFPPHQYAASHLHKAGNYFLLPLALMHTCVNKSFMHGKSANGSMPPQVSFPHKRGFQTGEIRLTI